MVPYLGKGVEGMERGIKLGLTCESRSFRLLIGIVNWVDG